ncbi:hypothetical protein L9F63_015964, partial [Diploptera punctata]
FHLVCDIQHESISACLGEMDPHVFEGEGKIKESLEEFSYILKYVVHEFYTLHCDLLSPVDSYKFERHYKTVHSNFECKYPKDSKLRAEKLKTLKMSIVSERKMMLDTVKIFKECFLVVCDTLFSKFPNAKQIKSDIEKLQLSDSTCCALTVVPQCERDKEYPELDSSSWWLKVGFLADITGILNDVQIKMQEEKLKMRVAEFDHQLHSSNLHNSDMSDLEDFDHVFGIHGEEEFDRVYQRIQLEEQENRPDENNGSGFIAENSG